MRALLSAHFFASLQQMGKAGRLSGFAFLAFAVVMLGLVSVPTLFFGAAMGSVVAARIDDPVFVSLLGMGVMLSTWAGGILSAFVTPDEEFGWSAYRPFPIPAWKLFVCELVAGTLSPFAIVSLSGFTGVFLGLGTSLPELAGLAFLGWFLCFLHLLAWRALVSAAGRELLRRMRTPVAVGGILLLGATSFYLRPLVQELRANSDRRSAAMQVLPQVSPWLPGGNGIEIVRRAHLDEWGPAAAWAGYGFLSAAAVLLSGYWLMKLERGTQKSTATGASAEIGWGFRSRIANLSRVSWATIFGSRQGKALFANFALVFLLCRDRQSFSAFGESWTSVSLVAARFSYVALIASQLHFNLFGLDRHGIKTLFLLPIGEEELLRGKIRTLLVFGALPALAITALLRFLDGYAWPLVAAGLCLWVVLTMTLSLAGAFFSSWRPIPFRDRRGNLETFVASGLVLFLLTGSVGAVFVVMGRYAPDALLLVMAGLAALTVVLYDRLMPFAARYLRSRREVVLDRIGG